MADKDEEYELRLRDQLAMAALPALIQRWTDRTTRGWIEGVSPNDSFDTDIKAIAVLAYKIADAMRKVRLQSFT